MRPTLYEFAGGDVERLAAYWAEVLGGPPAYSTTRGGDESAVLRMHAGNGDMSDLGERFVDCFVRALDDAALPSDPEFREAMRGYMRWAVDNGLAHEQTEDVRPGLAMPRWGWGGLEPPTAAD